MGEPVRILDLALNFIQAHGLRPLADPSLGGGPEVDTQRTNDGATIRVVFSGVRPGEKLYEELAYQAEELVKTAVDGVCAWDGEPVDRHEIIRMIADLSALRHTHDRRAVLAGLHQHVPELDQTRSYNLVKSPKQVIHPATA